MICVTNLNDIGEGCRSRLRSVVERAEAEDAAVVCLTPQPLRTVTYYRFDGGVIEAKYNCRNIKPAADR